MCVIIAYFSHSSGHCGAKRGLLFRNSHKEGIFHPEYSSLRCRVSQHRNTTTEEVSKLESSTAPEMDQSRRTTEVLALNIDFNRRNDGGISRAAFG